MQKMQMLFLYNFRSNHPHVYYRAINMHSAHKNERRLAVRYWSPWYHKLRTHQDFFSSRLFFLATPTHSLAVVTNAPQGSPRRLTTERRRATSSSEKYLLYWRTFWAAGKSPEGRILGGSSLQTTPTKPPSGKSIPGGYAAIGAFLWDFSG